MELKSCCGILSLQVGVAMVSVLYWLIGSLTFVVNFFDFLKQKEFPFYAFPIMLFVILFISAGTIAYASAFRESHKLCKIATAVMGVTFLLFLVLSAASFINSPSMLRYICVHGERCPESFWLASLRYRKGLQESYDDYEYDNSTDIAIASEEPEERLRGFEIPYVMLHDDTSNNKTTTGATVTKADEGTTSKIEQSSEDPIQDSGTGGYEYGLPFYGAIFLFLFGCLFLIYTAFLVWSYGQELVWVEKFLAGVIESESESDSE